MKHNKFNALILIGMIGIFTGGSSFAVQIYRAFLGNRDIWWTATTMPLGIDDTKGAFELSIDTKSIHQHLVDGSLFTLREDAYHKPIASTDIAVRLNNWDKVQSSLLAHALLPCFLFSASFIMLIIGVVQILSRKRQQGVKTDSLEL